VAAPQGTAAIASRLVSEEEAAVRLFDRLEDVAERWDVLRHTFYTRWNRGELRREELAFYVGEYRHLVIALAATACAASDPEHAAEEESHVELWDAFAQALGAELGRPPRAETVSAARAWTADGLEGLAVLYSVESAQPAISRTKLDGLLRHYGFGEGDGTRYFIVHAKLDEEHAARTRAALQARAAVGDEDRLVAAGEAALRGNSELLDGVCRQFDD
jgi:pyrroloquinoline-quinone synthase